METRIVECRHTPEGMHMAISCKGPGWYLVLVHLQSPGLVVSVHPGLQMGMGVIGGSGEAFNHLAPVNMKPMGENHQQ